MRFSNVLIFCGLAALIAGCVTSPEIPLRSPEVATPVKEVKPAAKSFKITDEQRTKLREQREKFMAERKAKMEAQMLDVVKMSIPEEVRAKALIKELEETMMASRRNMKRSLTKPTDSVSAGQGKAARSEVAPVDKTAEQRPQVTPEERRAQMREQREKFMAERKAKMETQMFEIVKKYVPEEDKAKVLVKGLQDAMMAGRRNMMRRPMKPAAEAK